MLVTKLQSVRQTCQRQWDGVPMGRREWDTGRGEQVPRRFLPLRPQCAALGIGVQEKQIALHKKVQNRTSIFFSKTNQTQNMTSATMNWMNFFWVKGESSSTKKICQMPQVVKRCQMSFSNVKNFEITAWGVISASHEISVGDLANTSDNGRNLRFEIKLGSSQFVVESDAHLLFVAPRMTAASSCAEAKNWRNFLAAKTTWFYFPPLICLFGIYVFFSRTHLEGFIRILSTLRTTSASKFNIELYKFCAEERI